MTALDIARGLSNREAHALALILLQAFEHAGQNCESEPPRVSASVCHELLQRAASSALPIVESVELRA